jgi:3-isopropylmalate/(R)-2-methylmalate dehydratase small subunit
VDCFRALGIGAIIAASFGAIYKRNAINSGLPILAFPDLMAHEDAFASYDKLTLNFATGRLVLKDGRTFQAEPFSQVQMDIYQAGDLFAYGKTLGLESVGDAG